MNTKNSQTCLKCQKTTPVKRLWVTTDYKNTAKETVKLLKFHRTAAAAGVIGRYLDQELPYFPPDTIVSYVPTAAKRVRQRGYDQSGLIAKEFARSRQLKCAAVLARSGKTRQVGAKRQERLAQMRGAFRVTNTKINSSAKLLLIDDVVTTGATLESAAETLRQAGFRRVNFAVFAQKNSILYEALNLV